MVLGKEKKPKPMASPPKGKDSLFWGECELFWMHWSVIEFIAALLCLTTESDGCVKILSVPAPK